MRAYLKPCEPFVLAPRRQPCDSFPPSSATTGLMHLPTSHLTRSLFFFLSGGGVGGCTCSLFDHFYVRTWPGAAPPTPPPPPPQPLHPHLRIPQVWSNVGRSSSSANWSGMYQPRGKERGGGGGLLTGKHRALHCSPTFAFHSSPLCFKITPFH